MRLSPRCHTGVTFAHDQSSPTSKRTGKLMTTKVAVRSIMGVALLAATAGSARAQSVAGLGGFGVGTSWFNATQPLQGRGFVALNAGLEYLDNAQLSTTGRRSDELGTVGVGVNYLRTGGQLHLSAFGNLDWVEYVHHSFSPEPYGHLSTQATWGRRENIFQWYLQDTFGEGTRNLLGAPTLANQEYINTLSTGPTLNFNFSRSTRLSVHGRYRNTAYQNSPFNSGSYEGGATFTWGLSPISGLSLGVDAARTRYNESGIAPTYDTRVARLSYRADLPRTHIELSGGYTEVNYTDTWTGAPTFSLSLTRVLGPYSSVFISGRTGYSTLGQSLTSNLGTPAGASVLAGVAPYASSPAPFKESFGSIGWHFSRLRTSIALAASIGRMRYERTPGVSVTPGIFAASGRNVGSTAGLVPLAAPFVRPFDVVSLDRSTAIDNVFETYSASLTRKLRPTLLLRLRAYLTHARYSNLDASSLSESYSLSLVERLGRTAFTLYAARMHRNTSGASSGLVTARYDADVVGLNVAYNLLPPRSGTRN